MRKLRKVIGVIAAVLALSFVVASCSLPVAYPPNPNAEDRPGPDYTIWLRNIGYPCEPPLWPLTSDDRNWESDIPAHGCVFEYTWMYDIGWCYDRSLALYGSAPTGAGNCEGLEWGTWNERLFRYSLAHVVDGTFYEWCIDHDMSCAPLSAPWRTNMVRSLDLSPEEIVAADLAAAAEYQEENRGVTDLGATVSDYTLDEQVDLYWDLGTVGVMDADEEEAVEAMGDTSPTVTWRDGHKYTVNPPGTSTYVSCLGGINIGEPNAFDTSKKNCWKHTWMWHAGWCGPVYQPFTSQTNYNNNKAKYCPNGTWPLTSTQTAPLMQWDNVRKFFEPTAAAQAWLDGKFASGWTPTSPTGW